MNKFCGNEIDKWRTAHSPVLRYHTCPVSTGDKQFNFASEQKKQDKHLACRGWLTNDTPDSLRVCALEDIHTRAHVHAHTQTYIHACIFNVHMCVCMYICTCLPFQVFGLKLWVIYACFKQYLYTKYCKYMTCCCLAHLPWKLNSHRVIQRVINKVGDMEGLC